MSRVNTEFGGCDGQEREEIVIGPVGLVRVERSKDKNILFTFIITRGVLPLQEERLRGGPKVSSNHDPSLKRAYST